MTLYQFLNQTSNLTTLITLMRNDVIKDKSIITYLRIYDAYNELLGTKQQKYKELAKTFKKHPKTIQKIILKLNKKIR